MAPPPTTDPTGILRQIMEMLDTYFEDDGMDAVPDSVDTPSPASPGADSLRAHAAHVMELREFLATEQLYMQAIPPLTTDDLLRLDGSFERTSRTLRSIMTRPFLMARVDDAVRASTAVPSAGRPVQEDAELTLLAQRMLDDVSRDERAAGLDDLFLAAVVACGVAFDIGSKVGATLRRTVRIPVPPPSSGTGTQGASTTRTGSRNATGQPTAEPDKGSADLFLWWFWQPKDPLAPWANGQRAAGGTSSSRSGELLKRIYARPDYRAVFHACGPLYAQQLRQDRDGVRAVQDLLGRYGFQLPEDGGGTGRAVPVLGLAIGAVVVFLALGVAYGYWDEKSKETPGEYVDFPGPA